MPSCANGLLIRWVFADGRDDACPIPVGFDGPQATLEAVGRDLAVIGPLRADAKSLTARRYLRHQRRID